MGKYIHGAVESMENSVMALELKRINAHPSLSPLFENTTS